MNLRNLIASLSTDVLQVQITCPIGIVRFRWTANTNRISMTYSADTLNKSQQRQEYAQPPCNATELDK